MDFVELNLLHRGNTQRTLNMVRRAIRMGYDSVVINIDVGEFGQLKSDQNAPPKKKRKMKDEGKSAAAASAEDVIPDPFLVDVAQLDLSSLEQAGKKFRQFSRLTVTLGDSSSVHKFQRHPKLKLYDVVALRFVDEQLLQMLSRKGTFVDLVTIEPTMERVPWIRRMKIIQACVAAGITFELCYSQALTSSVNRRQFFTNARMLMEATRGGRGVVLSSAAEDMIAIRAPYDAANLCTLFGVNAKNGRKFVSGNAKEVLLRAGSRRTLKGVLHVTTDLTAVPAANGRTPAETLSTLTAIPEFQRQLTDDADDDDDDTARKTISVVEPTAIEVD